MALTQSADGPARAARASDSHAHRHTTEQRRVMCHRVVTTDFPPPQLTSNTSNEVNVKYVSAN